MQRLVSYFIDPAKTIHIYSHQKDWRLWWGFIAIHAILSSIKISSIGLGAFLSYGIVWVSWLVVTALIIDGTAQFMGQKGELKTILYWLGFANTLLWLLPSASIIQNTLYLIGSLVSFALNIAILGYVWVTLKHVYKMSQMQLVGVFIIPCMSLVVMFIAFGVIAIQMASMIQ